MSILGTEIPADLVEFLYLDARRGASVVNTYRKLDHRGPTWIRAYVR